jgi:hypothetical protein
MIIDLSKNTWYIKLSDDIQVKSRGLFYDIKGTNNVKYTYVPKFCKNYEDTSPIIVRMQNEESLKQSSNDGPVIERPVIERPVSNRLMSNAPVIDKLVSDIPVIDRPVSNRLMSNAPVIERPLSNIPVIERPLSNRPVIERPVSNRPISDRLVSNVPLSNRLIIDRPVSDRPVSDRPVSNVPIIDRPVSNRPVSDRPVERPVEKHIEKPVERPVNQNELEKVKDSSFYNNKIIDKFDLNFNKYDYPDPIEDDISNNIKDRFYIEFNEPPRFDNE